MPNRAVNVAASNHRSTLRLLATMLVLALIAHWSFMPIGSRAEPPAEPPRQSETGRDEAQRVDFQRDVFPILMERCVACHGPDEQEGQLRLDARAIVRRGGVSGRMIVPGNSAESLLVARIVDDEAGDRMPLDDKPLSDEQIGVLRRWIDQGADWPDGVGSPISSLDKHWAYVKPQRPAPPAVSDASWVANPIDSFVLARLDRERIRPSPPAEKARLLRRVYLDLVGLPPSPAEVDAFLADDSPDAYDRVVERLLASPQYGVKWARSWLDAARYADTNGYQADQFRSVWPYRDWVIRAMNDDMPFDRFTIEQLAGDLLPEATLDQQIATGFHRLTTCNVEAGVDPEENRVNQIVDRVNTTGTVWLGTSIECGQCHSHKYDPFSQREYYGLLAYFNNTPLEVEGDGVTFNFVGPKMDLPLAEEQAAKQSQLQALREGIARTLDERTAELAKAQSTWEASLALQLSSEPEWHELTIERFESAEGASHTVLDDGSVLVGGKRPDTDDYTIVARTEWTGVTGFKLETLTDPTLPGTGPGRQNAERPNFVLQDFTVEARPCEDAGEPIAVSLHSAKADYSQPQYKVEGAIDADPASGWAIHSEFFKPHWATFLTTEPVGFDCGTQFVFKLRQHHGNGKTIGRLKLWAMTGLPSKESLPADVADALRTPSGKRNRKQTDLLLKHHEASDAEVVRLRGELAEVDKQLKEISPETTLVMIEQDEARETHLMKRGNFLDPGDKIEPGVPRVLHPLAADAPPNRIGLARWLVDDENPLTPRVIVNRWWAELFGRGLVATIEDFGSQGDAPSHPELLDWLAAEFRDGGWSMKRVHRLIVTSATYRQSSSVSRELLARDPDNVLLARGPRFRLPAELVRDNGLAAAGLLMTAMDGPPVYPPQPDGIWRHVGRNEPKYDTSQGTDRFRRGMYVFWRRSAPYPSFTNFDAPDRASCTVKRPVTNTPLQALTTLNDPAYVEMAAALARRIVDESPSSDTATRVAYGFRLCTSREPNESERDHLAAVFNEEFARLRESGRTIPAAAIQAASGDKDVSRDSPRGTRDDTEISAWFIISNILLNLDETITKG